MTAALIALVGIAYSAVIAGWVRAEREDAWWDGYWEGLQCAADEDARVAKTRAADAATGTPVWSRVARQMGVRP